MLSGPFRGLSRTLPEYICPSCLLQLRTQHHGAPSKAQDRWRNLRPMSGEATASIEDNSPGEKIDTKTAYVSNANSRRLGSHRSHSGASDRRRRRDLIRKHGSINSLVRKYASTNPALPGRTSQWSSARVIRKVELKATHRTSNGQSKMRLVTTSPVRSSIRRIGRRLASQQTLRTDRDSKGSKEVDITRLLQHRDESETLKEHNGGDQMQSLMIVKKVSAERAKENRGSNGKEFHKAAMDDTKETDTMSPSLKGIKSMKATNMKLVAHRTKQGPIPRLCHGLDRVLFNRGVYQLQDPRTRVFNFDPYLHKVLPVSEFNFNAIQQFETPSQDTTLQRLAERRKLKYYGSTSSMTGMLKHFHFLLSQWRPLNYHMLSRDFDAKSKTFSNFTKIPGAIFLRYKDGRYAIDADKYFDSVNIMSLLGHTLERLVTLPREEFERYKLSHQNGITSEEENNKSNAYNYTSTGPLLMRSQLDAHDPRLPGDGIFDVKTRAVVSIRAHGSSDHRPGLGYEVRQTHGQWESFEREQYDLIRNTMLAYSLQARIGRMDGIFMAYHNVERIFGFQYLGLEDLDQALHGQKDTALGNEEFKLSLKLLMKIFSQVTEHFPEQTIRLHFETRGSPAFMYIFAEPMTEEEADSIQTRNKRKNERLTKELLGLDNAEEGEEEENDLDPDGDDAEAWSQLRAKVLEQVLEQENNNNRLASEAAADVAEDDASVERRLLGLQIAAEGLKAQAQKTKESATVEKARAQEEEDADPEIFGEAPNAEAAEYKFIETLSSFHQLERKAQALKGEIEKDHGSHSRLLFYANHTLTLIRSQIDEISKNFNGDVVMNNEGVFRDRPSSTLADEGVQIQERLRPWPPKAAGVKHSPHLQPGPQPANLDKPLLALTLAIRNKVNDEAVERPTDFSTGDKWTVEYSISEIDDVGKAWALYHETKRRRMNVLDPELSTNALHYFRQTVQEYVKKGKEWREEQDKIEQEQGHGVVFEPYDKPAKAASKLAKYPLKLTNRPLKGTGLKPKRRRQFVSKSTQDYKERAKAKRVSDADIRPPEPST